MKDIKLVIKETEQKLTEKYSYSNPHLVPKIEKVIIHRGLSEALTNSAVLEKHMNCFMLLLVKSQFLQKRRNLFQTLS